MWWKKFFKETWCSWINHPNQQTRKKLEKKGGIEREQCLWMRLLEFFFERQNMMLVKQSCESTSNRWRKSERKKKLKGNTACECDDKKSFWKTKHDALDHQFAIADGPTPQLTDKVDWAIQGNTNQVLQRCAALVRRIMLRLQGQTATNFGAQLLWQPRQ